MLCAGRVCVCVGPHLKHLQDINRLAFTTIVRSLVAFDLCAQHLCLCYCVLQRATNLPAT